MYSRGFKLRISIIVTFDWIVTQRWVRGQSGGSWGWQTQLNHSQVCTTCISRAYTCIHVKYTCIHVKYTCYTPGNGLVVFATLKNPYFYPSHISEALEIFLSFSPRKSRVRQSKQYFWKYIPILGCILSPKASKREYSQTIYLFWTYISYLTRSLTRYFTKVGAKQWVD